MRRIITPIWSPWRRTVFVLFLPTVLACFPITLVRAQQASYFSMQAEQQREELERQRKEQDQREEDIAKNLFGHPPENASSEQLPVSNINQLDEARKQYWAAYEKGDRVKLLVAQKVFSDLLFLRDILALWTDPAAQDKPLDRLMAMTLHLSIPPGEEIPSSAQEWFGKWSIAFHGDIRPPGPGEATNIDSIIDSFKRHFPDYYPYQVARDWAEDMRAPVTLPTEQFVFGLVQRWPLPAPIEQAKKDYEVLLNTFGAARVFAVAEKVRSAMDQDGAVKDPAALGIDTSLATEDSEKTKVWRARVKHAEEAIANEGSKDYDYPHRTLKDWQWELATDKQMLQLEIRRQNGEHVGYYAHNCYEVFWTLLTKDDPKLSALCQIYRARLKETRSDSDPFSYRTGTLSLQLIVEQWQSKPAAEVTSSPQWYTSRNGAIAAATSQNKKIFLCVTSSDPSYKVTRDKMESFLSQREFVAASQNYILLKLWGEPILASYGVYSPDLGTPIFSFAEAYSVEQIISVLKMADRIPTPSSTPVPTPIPTPVPRPTPAPTPTPPPTPYPETADLRKETELGVRQEYDKAWTALPDGTQSQLHKEEVIFRNSLKTFDQPTRIGTIRKRIEYLKSLTPRSAAGTPAPNLQERAKDGVQASIGGEHRQLEPENQPSDVLKDRTGAKQDEPPSSNTPELPKRSSAEQILRDFIITGQADDVSLRASHLMDDLTKFYDRGAISRQEACALMAAYNRKWPIRRFRPDDLSVQVERIERGVFKLSQSFDWEVSDGRRQKTGRSRIVCEILRTGDDYKIISVDEVKE